MQRKARSTWERFIASHGGRVVEDLGGQAGAHYTYAICGGLFGDGIGLAREAKACICDGRIAVFAHIMRFNHGAHAERDLSGAAQRIRLARDGDLDARQIAFGGVQQFLALVGAFGRPDRDCGKQSDARRGSPGW